MTDDEILQLVEATRAKGGTLHLSDERKIEIATTPIWPSWPEPTRPKRGRPAYLRPLPALMRAARGWYHTLVRLPAIQPLGTAARLAIGATTAARVAAVDAALGERARTAEGTGEVADQVFCDDSTVRRARKRRE